MHALFCLPMPQVMINCEWHHVCVCDLLSCLHCRFILAHLGGFIVGQVYTEKC